jgi:hypothetical protein
MSVAAPRSAGFRKARPLLAALAVLAGACGGGDGAADSTVLAETTTPAPATSSTATASNGSATTATTARTSTTAPTPEPEPEPVVWVPTGPGDPLIPGQYGGLVQQGDCDQLRGGPDGEAQGSFWDVARQVCLAVTTGAEWPAVDAAPPAPDADGPFLNCLDKEVSAVIDAALAWHRQHPDRQPKVSYAKANALSPCERLIYGLTAVLVGEQDFELEIPSRPDLDADDIHTEVDGEEVALELDGVDSNRGTRRARIVLGGEWADGHTATVVLSHPSIERRIDVQLPRRVETPSTSDAEPPDASTTTT